LRLCPQYNLHNQQSSPTAASTLASLAISSIDFAHKTQSLADPTMPPVAYFEAAASTLGRLWSLLDIRIISLYAVSSLPIMRSFNPILALKSQSFQAQSLADTIFITMTNNTTSTTQSQPCTGNPTCYPVSRPLPPSDGGNNHLSKVSGKKPMESAETVVEMNWHCTPQAYSRAFIEFHASELAKQGGFDKVALRSNIHNTTSGPVPSDISPPIQPPTTKRRRDTGPASRKSAVIYNGSTRATKAGGIAKKPREYQTCDYHFTADFHNPKADLWEPAHVYTLTRKVGELPNGNDRLVHDGLATHRANPQLYHGVRQGHFKGEPVHQIYL